MAEAVKGSRYGYRDLDEIWAKTTTNSWCLDSAVKNLDKALKEQARQRREDADALAHCADY